MRAILSIALLISFSAFAEEQKLPSGSVVMSEKTVTIPVQIDATNMKLSIADYMAPTVKVLIPELAIHTLLDHRNTNEGAPCMATFDTSIPADVIQDNPGVEEVEIKITRSKQFYGSKDSEGNLVCHVSFNEIVEANIRGFEFVHWEYSQLPDRHIDDCK